MAISEEELRERDRRCLVNSRHHLRLQVHDNGSIEKRLASLQRTLNKRDPELIGKYDKQLQEQLQMGLSTGHESPRRNRPLHSSLPGV